MSMITSEADIQRVLDEYDWAHRDENCPVDRRRRERAEAHEEEVSRKARDAADRRNERRNQVALIDQRVAEHLGPLKEAFVEFIAGEVEPLRSSMMQQAQDAAAPLKSEIEALQTRLVDAAARAKDHADVERTANEQIVRALFGELVAKQQAGQRDEIQAALDNQAWEYERRIAALEKRVDMLGDVGARIEAEVAKRFVAGGPLSAAIDEGWQRRCADDREDLAPRIGAAIREVETKLGDLEERRAAHPGKLPMARAFVQGRVNYAGDIVVCGGSTYQATRDTAAVPPYDDDWVCLARAGRDAVPPTMRGDFDPTAHYKTLDVVEFDKSSYIARRDDPGPILGAGWQMLAARGKTGDLGPPGPRGERGDKGERGEVGLVGPPGPRGEKGERGTFGRDGIVGARGERGEKGEKGDVGPSGERGAEGPPGRLPIVKVFEPGRVHYQGDVVTHGGSLYQAMCDTARGIPHEDWVCLARAGRDAVSPDVCGTYDAHGTYKRLDIIAMDGATFIAKCDDPGICPGDGWQLMSRAGKPGRRGQNGERGFRGEKGDPGERGEPAPEIVAWLIDREGYRATPRMSDGTVGPMLELRELFEQFHWETS